MRRRPATWRTRKALDESIRRAILRESEEEPADLPAVTSFRLRRALWQQLGIGPFDAQRLPASQIADDIAVIAAEERRAAYERAKAERK